MTYLFGTTVFIIPLNMCYMVFLPHFSFDLTTHSVSTWRARLASSNITRLVSRNVILPLCSSKAVSLIIVSLYQTRPPSTYQTKWTIHLSLSSSKWITSIKFELQKFNRQIVLQWRTDTGTTILGNTLLPSSSADGWVKTCLSTVQDPAVERHPADPFCFTLVHVTL